MSTAAQLLAQYNAAAHALGEPLVKRFSDLKTAQRRTAAMVDRAEKQAAELKASAKKGADKPSRAFGGAESWNDPAVRAARATRHAVVVDGQEFRSVLAAFEGLGLPISKHIKFRGELKAAGKLEAFGMKWKVVAL